MSFWKNKKILITGITGFVGKALAISLLSDGAKVIGVSSSASDNELFRQIGIELITCPIEDYNKLSTKIRRKKIDLFFHLAAQSLVDDGTQSPLVTFDTNIRGTWNILEIARTQNVKRVIVASTSHVYGDNKHLPYKEEYFPQPSRPYETSKACADLIAQSYAETYGLEVVVPRFTNIYGPGDTNYSRIVPGVMREVILGRNPRIWDVGAVRDFLYIGDAISAYKKIAKYKITKSGRLQIYNFGSGKPTRIKDIAKKIVKLNHNKKIKLLINNIPKSRREEIKKQYMSIEKARKVLDWTPEMDLELGLNETYIWYKKYLKDSI